MPTLKGRWVRVLFLGVRRGIRNKFYGREKYKIRNREKEKKNEEKIENLRVSLRPSRSHLKENQWSLTIEGCNLARKENIILLISIIPLIYIYYPIYRFL